jgi:uncharacterized protein (DUF305 family)
MTMNARVRTLAPLLILLAAVAPLIGSGASAVGARQATPAGFGCEEATPGAGMAMGTPVAETEHDHAGMGSASPVAGTATATATATEFDRLYIDMMLPHHGSIVAMAEVALTRLEDERLRVIARRIIDTQSAERTELMGYRDEFYGSPDPAPMDGPTMDLMMAAMPGMGSMDEMMFQMDASAQVAAICAAEDADLAFIDLTIPHHEMAISASETALTQALHPEISAFARRVIADQSAEIDELTAIRAEIAGGTPQARTSAVVGVAS